MKQNHNNKIVSKISVASRWRIYLIASILLTLPGIMTLLWIFRYGLGIMPLNQGIFWSTFIINFIFWIGVAHAGTFISAILLLLRQNWRNEIHRFAEAMTIIAVMIAALMPIFHLGKPLNFYRLFPISERTSLILLNFSSPLMWDFYAIIIYFIVSVLFLYTGLLPFFAGKRNRVQPGFKKSFWNFLSWGWTGSSLQWNNFKQFEWILAILATPLVIAIHSIVSYDFAVTCRPGWHNTVFPLYFVVGAIMSGFAMIAFWIPLINILSPQNIIHEKHFDATGKIILACSVLLFLFFLSEILSSIFMTRNSSLWIFVLKDKILIIKYIMTILLTIFLPQLLWMKKYRIHPGSLRLISLFVLIGLWLERFVIVVGNSAHHPLTHEKIPFFIRFSGISVTLMTVGLFSTAILLIIRYLPLNSTPEHEKIS